jgi:hypothetical protein
MTREDNDPVQAEIDKLLSAVEDMATTLHNDMQQVKDRLSLVEKQVAHLGVTIASQWQVFNNHSDRMYKLEHPTGE